MLILSHLIIDKVDIKYIADCINDSRIAGIKKLDLSSTNLNTPLLKELFFLINGNAQLEEIVLNNNKNYKIIG